MHSSDPAVFNRVCGPLMSATADPADSSFETQVSVAAEMVSISATFSRQIRHIASPDDARDPGLIVLFSRAGPASLRIGGTVHPLDMAIVNSDVDFDIRAARPGDACTVGFMALAAAPDLVARMPHPRLLSGEEARSGRVESLRQFAEQVMAHIPRSTPQASESAGPDSALLEQLIRSQLDSGGWPDWPAAEVHASPGGRDIVAAVQRYLRDHAEDAELTPARLARHCAVSVRKLYNAFASVGMSLRATILSYRLEEARRQLHARRVKKVTSIAFDTGFRDVSTFYRNFRREFGYSPRSTGDTPPGDGERAWSGGAPVNGMPDEDEHPRPVGADDRALADMTPAGRARPAAPQKTLRAVRDDADAARHYSPYNAAVSCPSESHADSARLPRNTLFRDRQPSGRKPPGILASKPRWP